MQINMIAFAPLLPSIAKDMGIDMGVATNFMSVFFFTASIALIAGGVIADRFGIFSVMIVGLLCASIPAALMPWTGFSYGPVLVARLIQGLSAGFLMSVMSPIMAQWFPHRERGLAAGLMGASISLGAAAGVVAAPIVFVATGSWQQMAAWLSIVGWAALAATLLAASGAKSSPFLQALPGRNLESGQPVFRKALLRPFTWTGIVVAFFAAWYLQTLYNLIPAYLAADSPIGLGLGPLLSGKLMLSVMIAGMVGPVVGGLLQDKVFHGEARPVMLIGFVICAVFMFMMQLGTIYEDRFFLIGCLALTGAGIQFVYPGIAVIVSKSYPIPIVGKILGLWMGIGALGGAVGLFLGGASVARAGNYGPAVVIISLSAVAGFIATLLLRTRESSNNPGLAPSEKVFASIQVDRPSEGRNHP